MRVAVGDPVSSTNKDGRSELTKGPIHFTLVVPTGCVSIVVNKTSRVPFEKLLGKTRGTWPMRVVAFRFSGQSGNPRQKDGTLEVPAEPPEFGRWSHP